MVFQFFTAEGFSCSNREIQMFSKSNNEVSLSFIKASSVEIATQRFVNKLGMKFSGNAVFKSK